MMLLKSALFVVIGLAVLAAGLVAYAATQPDSFRVARSTTIAAPREAIFPLITDLRKFATWSPYEKKDPDMTRSFGGPESGKGQSYAWEGNGSVGAGSLVVADVQAPSRIDIDLNMLKPISAKNLITFTLEPAGGATKVTWSMQGQSPLMAKVAHLFFNVDKMVGGDFEAGLADLKAMVEGGSAAAPHA
ncbi:MAG: SRPBCC family protein [Hyphomicrobium sp.]|uniref:SRPBCC family protein n=1 Tax=Hyphomicrobium sp. TaxID=82 RepID=UPI003D0D27D1